MQKRIKKALATCLAVALVLGMFPTNALEALAATVKSGYEILVSPTLVYQNMYQDVENHKIAVSTKDRKAGVIDINNNIIVPLKYHGTSLEADGKLAVVEKDWKYGLYNTDTKKEIFPCKYYYIDVINSNFILLYTSWDSVRIYNSAGKAVTSSSYTDIYRINEELLMVYKNAKYGVMDINGKMVYDCIYSGINYTDDGDKIMLKDNTGVWKLYDSNDANNVVTLGVYDSVYDTGKSIRGTLRVGDMEKNQEFTYDGEVEETPYFYYWNYEATFEHVEEYEVLYVYDDQMCVLDIYNYSLEKIATYEHVDFVMKDGMFHQFFVNSDTKTVEIDCYYVYNGEGLDTILDLMEVSLEGNNSSGSNVYIGKVNDTQWQIFAANGSVATFNGNIVRIENYVDDCLVVEYDDNHDDIVDRYALADYVGDEIETLSAENGACYGVSPGLNGNFFFSIINGEKWLYGVGGKKICKVGIADDFVTATSNDGGSYYCVKNEEQNKTYILDENQDYIAVVDAFDYAHKLDEEYISINRYNKGNEILGFDGTIYFSAKNYKESRKESNGNWIARTNAGIWELYNSEFEKIGTLGNAEYISYDEELNIYRNYNYDDNWAYLEKFGVYSATGKAIIPTGSYKDYKYDYESNAWLVLNTKKQAIAFTAGGTKLCTIPDVKELGSFNDGYAVLKSTNDKYGIYKVTKLGHTHKTKTYSAKDATTSKNGYTSYKKCTICGDVTGKTTIYAASKISASSKNYNGKTQSVSLSVKDSKGKTISKSYYSVSGTKKAKKVGSYKVKITFKGKYTGSKTITWKINPTKTKFTKVTAGKKKITLKWSKKTTQVTGYKIQYSTDKNFKKSVKTVTIKKNKTTSKTISKLKSKKKYYVRICTYKGSYTSGWSSAKAVTVK